MVILHSYVSLPEGTHFGDGLSLGDYHLPKGTPGSHSGNTKKIASLEDYEKWRFPEIGVPLVIIHF